MIASAETEISGYAVSVVKASLCAGDASKCDFKGLRERVLLAVSGLAAAYGEPVCSCTPMYMSKQIHV
jgi:hypothetical protein